ncbi:MAG: hypothetical protein JSS30_02350 [Verrucomicrobia bacterium]|nr:hypothetical protein [Verrucomicrobiota bacterium]
MPIEINSWLPSFADFFSDSTPPIQEVQEESKPEPIQEPGITPTKGWGEIAFENKEKIALAVVGAVALCAAVYFRNELLSPFTTAKIDNRQPLWFDFPKPSPLEVCPVRPGDFERTYTLEQHFILQGTKEVMGELMRVRKSIADTAQCLRDGCWPDLMHFNATEVEQRWLEEAGLNL